VPIIINGGSRSAGSWWAKHLGNTETNDRVEMMEMIGLTAQSMLEAFQEMRAVSRGTKCTNYFYQANINPREDETLTPVQWREAVDTLERNLGLTGQPRFVVEHEKNGRTHQHIVWSRIDPERMVAISDSLTAIIHEQTSRELEIKFDLQRGKSVLVPGREGARPERRPKKHESFRSMESGIDAATVKDDARRHWESADNAQSFKVALELSGDYVLARGDRRDFVIIDRAGDDHSLGRRLGIKAAELRSRMADLDPATLPSVAEAKSLQHERQVERQKQQEINAAAERAMHEARAAAKGRYDQLHATHKGVERKQSAGRYDALRAAEPPPEIARDFASTANRTTEPAAPNYDRDAYNGAWEAQIAEAAINAEAGKGRQRSDEGAGLETRAARAEASGGQQRPTEREDTRPLSQTAGDILTAWKLSRSAQQFEEALAARGITLAQVSGEEPRQSQRTAAFAKEIGNYARVLTEGEIVAVNLRGDVYRLDARTTGEAHPDIAARFPGLDRAILLDVTAAKEAMREASREIWRNDRQAEREKARSASWVEQRIGASARIAGSKGTTIQVDRDGNRVNENVAFADRLRPVDERETRDVEIHGPEAFAVLLERAGIALVRVTEHDTKVLDSLREVQAKDQMLAGAIDEISERSIRLDRVLFGDLAAVTRKGDVYAINPEKMGDATRYLAGELPGLTETRDKMRGEREATTEFWAGFRADNAEARTAHDAAFQGERAFRRTVRAAEHGVEETLHTGDATVNSGMRAASVGLGGLAKAVERVLSGIFSFFGAGEPKLTPQQQELAANAYEERTEAAAEQEVKAEREAQHWLVIEAQQKATLEREAAEIEQERARMRRTQDYERER
jgi:hypothetical protein